jgi:hypothetical protein
LDASGTNALPNGTGVDIEDSANVIGGTTVGARNTVVATSSGINIGNGSGNSIQGNFIGTDVTGTIALGSNANSGIFIDGSSSGTQVGGLTSTPGAPPGNVVSGNASIGINIANAINNNTIQGNLVGTDATGTGALGNASIGITVHGSFNVIGSSSANARNVISGNNLSGIQLGTDNASVHDNVIQGNFVGTDITVFLPNGQDGVHVDVSTNNMIGGTIAGAGNVIAGNAGSGVSVVDPSVIGLTVEGNSIFGNGVLGIDLGGNGPTLNDIGDVDTSANNLQNFPVITSVTRGANFTNFSGMMHSAPNTTYHLEFFANDAIDPSGYGEGQDFLVAIDIPTNANGDASFAFQTPNTIGADQRLTATATDPNGNTSEFSAAIGQLLNLSTRMRVLTGNNVLIGGFIISGTGNKSVLLRALGPTLSQFGVADPLQDPTIELHDGTGALLASNDNWKDTQQTAITATNLAPPNVESAILSNNLARRQLHRHRPRKEQHHRRRPGRSLRSG